MYKAFKFTAGVLSIIIFSLSFQSCKDEDGDIVANGSEQVDNSHSGDGFDAPKTEEFDGGSITFQYNDNVIALEQSSYPYIVKVEADTIIYFSKSIPDKFKPYVGKIISSGVVDEKTPYGLGNKIVSVVEHDGLYECVTTNASLDEIFKELSFSADIGLITDTISQVIEDVDGNICDISVSSQGKSRVSIGSPDLITINIGKSRGIYAAGSISLGAVATINLDLKRRHSEISLATYAGIDGEIGGMAQYWEGYKKILPRKGRWKIVTGVVSLGPIVLRPYIDAELGLKGRLKGEIKTGISKQFGFQFGIKNGNGFSQNLTASNTDIINNFSADAIGDVALVLDLDFGIGLYTTNMAAGIKNSVQAGFSVDFQLNNANLFKNNSQLDFNITADADAFLVARFFGKEFVNKQESLASVNFFSYNWPLLPSLEANSLKVVRRNDDPLTYVAEYELTGGLLNVGGLASEKLSMIPAFRVYDGEQRTCQVMDDEQTINGIGKQKFLFELNGLEDGVTYVGTPCLSIAGNIYEEDGIEFPSMCGDAGHPHVIDLGLPSGTRWGCMNVGASCPTDFGEYYKLYYDRDIAVEKMGPGYSTPTKEQFEELIAYTRQRHAMINGVNGMLFEALNGNSIFLPAAAQLWWDDYENIWDINGAGSGAYWTITPSVDENYYYFLEFSEEENEPWLGDRGADDNKLPIRPVCTH